MLYLTRLRKVIELLNCESTNCLYRYACYLLRRKHLKKTNKRFLFYIVNECYNYDKKNTQKLYLTENLLRCAIFLFKDQ